MSPWYGPIMTQSSVTHDAVAAALRRLQRLHASRRVYARMASASGTDCSQQSIAVLSALDDGEARSISEAAELARIDQAAASRQIRQLVEQGLVERDPSPPRGRVTLVRATPAGLDTAHRVREVRDRHLQTALARWSTTDRETLGRLLGRLVDDLERTPFNSGIGASA